MKRCACGRTYSAAEWSRLRVVGIQHDGLVGRTELRNCACGSTMGLDLPTESEQAEPLIGSCARCGQCELLSVWRGRAWCAPCEFVVRDWAVNCETYARGEVLRVA